MGKNLVIDGNRFELRLPASAEWDAMMDDLGEGNDLWHWDRMFSWCEDEVNSDPSSRAFRGYISARFFNYNSSGYRFPYLGFRPVLVPLNSDALDIDGIPFAGMDDGTKFCLGTLYLDGAAQRSPITPVYKGDIPEYDGKATIRFRDTDQRREYQIGWVKWKGLLIADRVILINVSWNDLNGPQVCEKCPLAEICTMNPNGKECKAILQFGTDKIYAENKRLAAERNALLAMNKKVMDTEKLRERAKMLGVGPVETKLMLEAADTIDRLIASALKDIPHKCWTCVHSIGKGEPGCSLVHYKSNSPDCLSWEWRRLEGVLSED